MKTVLIPGAGYPQIDAIEYCKSKGYRVAGCSYRHGDAGEHLLDEFKQVDIKDAEGLAAFAQECGASLIYTVGSDVAMPAVMEASEKARKNNPGCGKGRDGIIHCQIMNPDQYEKMKDMGLIGYIQPIFLNYDYKILVDRVGEEKAATSYGWKTMFDTCIDEEKARRYRCRGCTEESEGCSMCGDSFQEAGEPATGAHSYTETVVAPMVTA